MAVDYKKIILLRQRGMFTNTIAKNCGCKWETVRRTIDLCEKEWGSISNIPQDLTSDDIAWVINSTNGRNESFLMPDCEEIIERCRKGEKRSDVWEDYASKATELGFRAYQISRFNEIVSAYASRHDIIVTLQKLPGQEAQVDWVGDKARIIDYDTKEVEELHIFVMVLPCSGYFYCEAFSDETMSSWLMGHKHAFEFFGGVPDVVVPDNCRTATEEARHKFIDEVVVNRKYKAFMDHYDVVIAPARAWHPKDKPVVERSVRIIEDDIMPLCAKMKAGSVAEYNRALHSCLEVRLAKEYTKRLGSRTSIFRNEEEGKLRPLPVMDFTIAKERQAIAGRDYRVQYCHAFYSVPWQYAGQSLIIRDENGEIVILNRKREIIARHPKATHKWQRMTDPSHDPEDFKKFSGMTPDSLVFRANRVCDSLGQWAQAVFSSAKIPSDRFRTVDAVIRHASLSNRAAVEEAARIAIKTNAISVKAMKNLISNAENRLSASNKKPEESVGFSFTPAYIEKEAHGEDK